MPPPPAVLGWHPVDEPSFVPLGFALVAPPNAATDIPPDWVALLGMLTELTIAEPLSVAITVQVS